jgi:hypothetical protein
MFPGWSFPPVLRQRRGRRLDRHACAGPEYAHCHGGLESRLRALGDLHACPDSLQVDGTATLVLPEGNLDDQQPFTLKLCNGSTGYRPISFQPHHE